MKRGLFRGIFKGKEPGRSSLSTDDLNQSEGSESGSPGSARFISAEKSTARIVLRSSLFNSLVKDANQSAITDYSP